LRSTFFGLEIGRRGLQAQQRALDVTGHNVTNANTPGFTRQEAVLVTTTPFPVPSLNRPWGAGQVGTGVEIAEIRRLRDAFLDLQVRHENRALGYWEARRDALQKVEVIFNEPSDSGLRTVFEQFWQALEDLSKNPESSAARSVVRQRGIALAETFNHMDRQLRELQEDLDGALKVKVSEINSLGRQIADLNQQILKIEVTGARANDLRDKRDVLLDQMAKLINFQAHEDEKGLVNINIGGRPLVQGEQFYGFKTREDPANEGLTVVCWETDGEPVQIEAGVMRGLIEMRGYVENGEQKGFVREMRKKLDALAATLVEKFNNGFDVGSDHYNGHRDGYGLDGTTENVFFSGNSAATIEVVIADLNKIAAATTWDGDGDGEWDEDGEPGDGSNALKLAQLKQQLIMKMSEDAEPTATFEDYLRAAIGQLGVEAQEADRMVENQELLVAQLENNRQAVSGVSLDEEMVNMIRFQHAYNAAARVITAMDEMLDLIISRMGLVGR
jgi:flagellar hook-associated protein 1 FlgK